MKPRFKNMEVRMMIREHLEKFDDQNFEDLVQEILDRIPSIQDYNRFDNNRGNERAVKFQRHVFVENSKIGSINQELNISYRYFNERKWFNISMHNEALLIPNGDMSLERTVEIHASSMMNKKFSLSLEIPIKDGESFPEDKFDQIINDLNQKTFEFEAYLKNSYKIRNF